jgi:hypothetical protein
MKFLCLAYGDEKDWKQLTRQQQDELLAQDQVLLRRGATIHQVGEGAVTVRAWDGTPKAEKGPIVAHPQHFAGFSIIEARDLDEAIAMVGTTPCAVARGAIEIWPIVEPTGGE